jgi:hypothetical protein
MGAIIGLNGNLAHPLTITIRAAFLADGSVSQGLEGLPNAIHAVLRDWAADERELQIHEQTMREAVDVSALSNEMLAPTRCLTEK